MRHRTGDRRRASWVVGCAVVGALAVSAGGCGVDAGDAASVVAPQGEPAAAVLVRAAETTAAVRSQKVWMQVSGGAGGVDVDVTVEGAFDADSGRGRLTTTTSGFEGLPIDLGDLSIETVFDRETVYLRVPSFAAGPEAGSQAGSVAGSWWSMDLGEAGSVGEQLGRGIHDDPTDVLALLEGAAGEVEVVGREDVRGVSTTRHRAEIDPARSLDRLDPEARERLQRALGETGALPSVPVEVWIDDDGYVRRLTVSFDTSSGSGGSGSGGSGSVVQTIELYDFDVPVDIELPDPDDVSSFDLSELWGD